MSQPTVLSKPRPTPDTDLNAVLAVFIGGVWPILGDNFVGAYLQGSFAVGDPCSHSDVDFVVVVQSDVPAAQEPALQAVHVAVYDLASDWARHLEGSYFPADLLRRPETVGQPLLYIDNGSRVVERSAHDNTLVARWVLREHGVTLVGPPPSTLLEPVSAPALRSEVWRNMQAWNHPDIAEPERMNNDWAQPFVVLNNCRMLLTLMTGRFHSKDAGAIWAIQQLGPQWRGLIERAQAAHTRQRLLGRQPADPSDLASTPGFLQAVLHAGQAIVDSRA